MGCGVSQFKREETELSNKSRQQINSDKDAHKHGRRSDSSQPNNDDNHEKGSKDRLHSEDDHLLEIDHQRQDFLKYPGSPSFRFYCDPNGHQVWKSPSRPRNTVGTIVDHVPKKKSNVARSSNEGLLDSDKALGGKSSKVVKKGSRVERITGAIFLRSSKQQKSLCQMSQS